MSAERGVDRRRRSPSFTKLHADEKKGRRDERSRSRDNHRDRRHPSEERVERERVRGSTPTKRRRSVSAEYERRGESSTKPREKEVAESSKKDDSKKDEPEVCY